MRTALRRLLGAALLVGAVSSPVSASAASSAYGVNGKATDHQFRKLNQLEQKRDAWAPSELQKASRVSAPPQEPRLERSDRRADRAGREQLRTLGGL